jgi:hypothetical protein
MAAVFSHVAGIFYILICGLVLAMFTALLEFCYKVHHTGFILDEFKMYLEK